MQDSVSHSAKFPEKPAPLSGPNPLLPDPLIKLERHSPSNIGRHSPSSPFNHPGPSFIHIPSFASGRTPNTRKKRSTHPYIHPPPRVSSGRRQNSSTMSAPHYGNWPSDTAKYEQPVHPSADLSHAQGKSSDGNQPPYYITSDNTESRYPPDIRPDSSGSMISSSLTGAMGGPRISTHSSPSSDRSPHNPSSSSRVQPTPMDWHSSIPQPGNVIVAAGIPTSFYPSSTTPSTHSHSSANPNSHYPIYNQYDTPNLYEQSESFMPSTSYPSYPSRPGPSTSTLPDIVPLSMPLSLTGPYSAPVRSSMRKETMEEELKLLRSRVRELEIENAAANRRVRELHAAMASGYPQAGIQSSGLPFPVPNPPNMNAFQASWDARTNARIRAFCSLNRAGNALCAWHDSRRERRAHPPRNAPDGYLNCGCTVEEALFEESLARHDIGSYHPGESVRMDPVLRNPLLKLLKQRYGYRDGDFERDPITGTWVEGEGPDVWESRALSGNLKRRQDDRKP